MREEIRALTVRAESAEAARDELKEAAYRLENTIRLLRTEARAEQAGTMTRATYELLVSEDLEWLLAQPRSLERDHIECLLRFSPAQLYGDSPTESNPALALVWGVRHRTSPRTFPVNPDPA